MSNEMFLGETKFHIDRSKEKDAEAALKEVARSVIEKKGVRAEDIKNVADQNGCEIEDLTLDQLVESWGWLLIRELENETDKIIDIELLEDFSSDEETLFEVLGPFVTAGSYIDVDGMNDGGVWKTRYGFTGKRMVELEMTFPPIPLE